MTTKGPALNRFIATEIAERREALSATCRKYGVSRLDLFGSGTTEEWDPGASDLDFVVSFQRDPDRSLADRYLGLADELETLFGRPVDLLTERSIRNPYFRRNVDATRSVVYAE